MKKEKTISVNLKNNGYKIHIKNGIIENTGDYLNKLNLGKKVLIVTESKIPNIYLKKIKSSIEKHGFKTCLIILNNGEENKNLNSLLKIINIAVHNKFERKDTFLSLGGGIVSDLTGFAASIYYRGVNFIALPTSLLAMVDASVGGKTSINITEGKNLLGSFYQPKTVLIDPSCLKTLPKRELLVGLSEIIKYALIEKTAKTKFQKETFFDFLRQNKKQILNLNSKILNTIISYSVLVKANIVSKDEKEKGLRAILNLGHTFAHGIEQAYSYKKYTHGEAVSIGMCFALKLAYKENLISKSIKHSTTNMIKDFGLPVQLPNSKMAKKIFSSMTLDKKVKDGKIVLILPYKKIGMVKIIDSISTDKIKNILVD